MGHATGGELGAGGYQDEPRVIRANGVDLCVQTFGEPDNPAILLICGAGASMDWWDPELCRRLAAGDRFVIRYDGRDTGRSVTYPAGAPAYSGQDLASDALGVLDALGVARAHLVGISMGGALAQVVAAEQPERVASLVLMSTTAIHPGGPGEPPLPGMSAELRAAFAAAKPPDWSDRTAVVTRIVETERAYEGPRYFDEAAVRALAELIVDRSIDMAASMTNPMLIAGRDDSEPSPDRLSGVTAPTLVVHGTVDPLFPYAHAEALARRIPGAALLPLADVGHQVPPPPLWPTIIPALLQHTATR